MHGPYGNRSVELSVSMCVCVCVCVCDGVMLFLSPNELCHSPAVTPGLSILCAQHFIHKTEFNWPNGAKIEEFR